MEKITDTHIMEEPNNIHQFLINLDSVKFLGRFDDNGNQGNCTEEEEDFDDTEEYNSAEESLLRRKQR